MARVEALSRRSAPLWSTWAIAVLCLVGTVFQLRDPLVDQIGAFLPELFARHSVEGMVVRLRCKDGTYRWLEWRAAPAGGLIYACARGMTDHRKAEETQLRLTLQLAHAEKMESLGSLAGGVAHDMNNVLAAILALATVHQLSGSADADLATDMDTIVKACQRGKTLVQGLLRFARQDLAEQRSLFDQFFDWSEIVSDVTKRPFIALGFATFSLMVPLAVSSVRRVTRWMGPGRWKALHRLIYVVAVGGVVHYLWLVKADRTSPLVHGAILTLLLAWRAWNFWRARRANSAAV